MWPGAGGRRGCWCWGRIARWRRLCGRTPCGPWCRSSLVHGQGAELSLGEWAEAGVAAYLAQRGAGVAVPARWRGS